MNSNSWKTPLIAILIALAVFLGVGSWLYAQQGGSIAGSVQMDDARSFPGSRFFLGDGDSERNEEESLTTTTLSESTELDAIEQDLNSTVILDEDFSDL